MPTTLVMSGVRTSFGLAALAAAVILIIALFGGWQGRTAAVSPPTSAAIAANPLSLQLAYLDSLRAGPCRVISSHKLINGTWQAEKIGPENVFLLTLWSGAYNATGDRQWLERAQQSLGCFEQYADLASLAPFNRTSSHQFWGTWLFALVRYAQLTGEPLPDYADRIAKHLLSLPPDTQPQYELRRIRGLAAWGCYRVNTTALYHAGQAINQLARQNSPEVLQHNNTYVAMYTIPQFLRALCELQAVRPLARTAKDVRFWLNATEDVASHLAANRTADGSLITDPGYSVLVWYQIAVAADACLESAQDDSELQQSEQSFMQLLDRGLQVQLGALDQQHGGVIEAEQRKTLSLNAEIARLLFRWPAKFS